MSTPTQITKRLTNFFNAVGSILVSTTANAAYELVAGTAGSLLVIASSVPTWLGIGSTGQVLTVVSGAPAWATPGGNIAGHTYVATEIETVTLPAGTFNLLNAPVTGTVSVFVNGMKMAVGTTYDYTISGQIVTFTTAALPASGDTVTTTYFY